MKLPTSNKTSNFTKPLIKKGYYPAQLIKVELYTDSEGNAKIGKYGKQLIFEFAIYAKDKDDAPTEPMTFKSSEEDTSSANVIIPKFVYHEYMDKKHPGEFQTAITPNSAITKLLTALGWTFSIDDVDPEDYIGKWVEANIDDYESGEGDDKTTASTIKDIGKYKGPKPSDDMVCVKPKEKTDVKKQVKHEAVEEKIPDDSELKKAPIEEKDVSVLQSKIDVLTKMNKEGFLTDQGLKDAVEQLETKIDSINKK